MTIYLVISNGDFNSEVDGAFFEYEDAKSKFEEIKKDWLENWAEDCEYDCYDEDDDYFAIDNFTLGKLLELKIETVEVQ